LFFFFSFVCIATPKSFVPVYARMIICKECFDHLCICSWRWRWNQKREGKQIDSFTLLALLAVPISHAFHLAALYILVRYG